MNVFHAHQRQRGHNQNTLPPAEIATIGGDNQLRGADPEMARASYVPGPALRRLTPAARQRLQENLILAVGPDTALATAITVRRSLGRLQK